MGVNEEKTVDRLTELKCFLLIRTRLTENILGRRVPFRGNSPLDMNIAKAKSQIRGLSQTSQNVLFQ